MVPWVTVRIVASLISTLPPVLSLGSRSASNSVATSTNGFSAAFSSGLAGLPAGDGPCPPACSDFGLSLALGEAVLGVAFSDGLASLGLVSAGAGVVGFLSGGAASFGFAWAPLGGCAPSFFESGGGVPVAGLLGVRAASGRWCGFPLSARMRRTIRPRPAWSATESLLGRRAALHLAGRRAVHRDGPPRRRARRA